MSQYICDSYNTNLTKTHSISSPMTSSCMLSKITRDLFFDPTLYRFVIGSLQYVTLTLKLALYSTKFCQFVVTPFDTHWVAMKRII